MHKNNDVEKLKNMPDEELYLQAGIGNENAFQTLLFRHYKKVWRLSFNILGDEKDSEDVVQEVFLSVWKKRALWENGAAKFSTWLYRVSINKAIDFKRKKTKTPTPMEGDKLNLLQEEISPSSDFPLPVDILLKKEASQEMNEIILSLPRTQKRVIDLFYFEEMTVPEIAQYINNTEVAVRSLLKRARKSIRETITRQKKICNYETR